MSDEYPTECPIVQVLCRRLEWGVTGVFVGELRVVYRESRISSSPVFGTSSTGTSNVVILTGSLEIGFRLGKNGESCRVRDRFGGGKDRSNNVTEGRTRGGTEPSCKRTECRLSLTKRLWRDRSHYRQSV